MDIRIRINISAIYAPGIKQKATSTCIASPGMVESGRIGDKKMNIRISGFSYPRYLDNIQAMR
jgi:hypothetical protein